MFNLVSILLIVASSTLAKECLVHLDETNLAHCPDQMIVSQIRKAIDIVCNLTVPVGVLIPYEADINIETHKLLTRNYNPGGGARWAVTFMNKTDEIAYTGTITPGPNWCVAYTNLWVMQILKVDANFDAEMVAPRGSQDRQSSSARRFQTDDPLLTSCLDTNKQFIMYDVTRKQHTHGVAVMAGKILNLMNDTNWSVMVAGFDFTDLDSTYFPLVNNYCFHQEHVFLPHGHRKRYSINAARIKV